MTPTPKVYYIGPYRNDKGNVATFVTTSRDKVPATMLDLMAILATSESNARRTYRRHFPNGLPVPTVAA